MRKYLIGIDEAGRGPLAGPVSLGAVAVPVRNYPRARRIFSDIKDSKELSPKKREYWYRLILKEKQRGTFHFACAYSSNEIIDRKGISWAIRSALGRALNQLEREVGHYAFKEATAVLLDGSLKAPPEYGNQQTIIRGDEKLMVIAMASIVAKVRRDRLVHRLAKRYPGYGWETHVGYGTKAHYRALRELGPSPLHRQSFLRSLER